MRITSKLLSNNNSESVIKTQLMCQFILCPVKSDDKCLGTYPQPHYNACMQCNDGTARRRHKSITQNVKPKKLRRKCPKKDPFKKKR